MAKRPKPPEPTQTPEKPPAEPPLGIDAPKDDEPEARGRQTAAPTCPIHKIPCKSNHSTPIFTYYYCPDESCAFSVKQQRPRLGQARIEPDEDFSARP